MRQVLRQGVECLPPPFPIWIRDAFRQVRHPRAREYRRAQRRAIGRLPTPGRVCGGPFQGMHYIGQSYSSDAFPKIAGTYEMELAPAIEAICRSGRDAIVNVGSAEGYYAVGLALRNPEARIVGFDLDPSARFFLRRLARRNGVSDRIAVEGACTLETLGQALAGRSRPAVICDCEGAEVELLDPDRVPALRRAIVLVETHDGLETNGRVLEGITQRLLERFAPTHEAQILASRPRDRNDLPEGCAAMDDDEAAEAMHENRAWAQWLFLQPKADHDTGPA